MNASRRSPIEVNEKKKRPLCLYFMCNKICFFSRIKTVLSSFLTHSLFSKAPISCEWIEKERKKIAAKTLC